MHPGDAGTIVDRPFAVMDVPLAVIVVVIMGMDMIVTMIMRMPVVVPMLVIVIVIMRMAVVVIVSVTMIMVVMMIVIAALRAFHRCLTAAADRTHHATSNSPTRRSSPAVI